MKPTEAAIGDFVVTIKSTCPCFKVSGSNWIALSPDERHAYRVQCAGCAKFLKWGTAEELARLEMEGAKITVKPYKPPQPSGSVLDLFK